MAAVAPTTVSNGIANQIALNEAANIGDLTNKIALITGASSGLGRAIAQAYALAGAYVVNADLNPQPPPTPILANTFKDLGLTVDLTTPTADLLNKTVPSQNPAVPRASYIQTNVTNAASVEAAVAFTVATYGRLDIMVNNAGIGNREGPGQTVRTHEESEEMFDKTIAVNLKGVWLGTKYAAGQMLRQEPHVSGDRGWIINLCSILGLVGMAGVVPYCASKGGVLQITRSSAVEYAADKIHINCINPGFTETNILENTMRARGSQEAHALLEAIHPWGRLGLPHEIAKVAVFLAGPGAGFCTGQAFVVDGGYTAQ